MPEFEPNDQVRHPGKPEWGTGTVLAAQKASHEGAPCQRLTVRFSGAGKKTLNTAFAELKRLEPAPGKAAQADNDASKAPPKRPISTLSTSKATPNPTPAAAPAQAHSDDPIEKPLLIARLTGLPDTLADPFRAPKDRLAETFNAYRYRPGDRTLLEWAVAQSGVADPLSLLSRHELEEHYATFRIRLDRHLKALLEEARRARLDTRPIIDRLPPAIRAEVLHALRRINPGR
jgi:hypothetical protein